MNLELYSNEEWADVGGLELLSLDQVEISQSAGSLSFEYELDDPSESFRFTTGDTIGLRGRDSGSDDWSVLFFGTIFEDPERKYQANSVRDAVIAHDAWNDLERTAYQVEEFVAEAYNKSHVILFRDQRGERMTTGQQVKAILDYAIAQGVAVSYVQSDLDGMTVQPPSDERTDLSCAEAIQRCLSWQPDYFTMFDYAESGSVLRFYPSDQESTIRLPLAEVLKTGGFTIKKKSDMTLRGVVINYEIENKIIDGTTQSVFSDAAGASDGPNVLVHTVQVDGSYQIATEQSIVISVAAIPSNYKSNIDFARLFFPDICFFPSNTTQNNLPASIPYPFYITSGYQAGYGVVSFQMTFSWWVATAVHSTLGYPVSCDFSPKTYVYAWRSVSLNLTSSNAGTYTRQGPPITIPGELIPTGVADALYAARLWPLYDGVAARSLPPLANIATPKNNMNILNGLAEYESMRAPVQRVTRDYFSEIETIKFGHPEQAGITDYIDMLRANRTVNRPTRRTWRTD